MAGEVKGDKGKKAAYKMMRNPLRTAGYAGAGIVSGMVLMLAFLGKTGALGDGFSGVPSTFILLIAANMCFMLSYCAFRQLGFDTVNHENGEALTDIEKLYDKHVKALKDPQKTPVIIKLLPQFYDYIVVGGIFLVTLMFTIIVYMA